MDTSRELYKLYNRNDRRVHQLYIQNEKVFVVVMINITLNDDPYMMIIEKKEKKMSYMSAEFTT